MHLVRASQADGVWVLAVLIRGRLLDGQQYRPAVLVHSPNQLNCYTGERLTFRVEHTPADRAGGRGLDAKQQQKYRKEHLEKKDTEFPQKFHYNLPEFEVERWERHSG